MQSNDNDKNRGTHGDISFMLGGLPSSSENPPALAVGSVKFGQLMMNVFGRMGKDPFFPEDDEMIRYIEQFVEENYRVILRTHWKRGDGSD